MKFKDSFNLHLINIQYTSKAVWTLFLCIVLSLSIFSQNTIDEAIEKYNDHTVTYISTDELIELQETNKSVVLLDTRSSEEYQISHVENAYHVGYKKFDIQDVTDRFEKNELIIVYCSIGVRSEVIGKKLQTAGYEKVYNLFGGIFEWHNQGYSIVDNQNNKTDRLHAYDRYWGKFITKAIKVYE